MENVSDGGASTVVRSWDAEVWGRLLADTQALDGSSEVFQRRRAVVLRLLARGLTLPSLEELLPGWSDYLRPPGPARRG